MGKEGRRRGSHSARERGTGDEGRIKRDRRMKERRDAVELGRSDGSNKLKEQQ